MQFIYNSLDGNLRVFGRDSGKDAHDELFHGYYVVLVAHNGNRFNIPFFSGKIALRSGKLTNQLY